MGLNIPPNYTAGILELLVKASYADDVRVGRGFDWLRDIRAGHAALPKTSRMFLEGYEPQGQVNPRQTCDFWASTPEWAGTSQDLGLVTPASATGSQGRRPSRATLDWARSAKPRSERRPVGNTIKMAR